jgi:protein involved in polysaccharide export with SLBB domain
LRGDITTALQPAYKNPISVNVTLLESGNMSVFVGGEVKTPGHYPYSGSTTLLQALASAGWINEWADLGKIVLLHPSAAAQGQYVVYETNLKDVVEGKGSPQDLKLAPRDIIIVPRSGIAKVDLWVDQYIRKFLPFSMGVGYTYGQGDFSSRVSQ